MEITKSENLFIINALNRREGSVTALISINKQSHIFKGHFRGQPVVPGACMLQLIRDVLEKALEKPLQLKRAASIKFLSMIDPYVTNEVQLDILYKVGDDSSLAVAAKLAAGDVICLKFQGCFE